MASPAHGSNVSGFPFAAPLRAVSTVAILALAASCAPAVAMAQGVALRVVVKLAVPSDDGPMIAAEASRQAGVPVAYAAAIDGAWHALSLQCTDRAACEDAMARLRHSERYLAVDLDERKHRVTH
jgi:hypothetical protein